MCIKILKIGSQLFGIWFKDLHFPLSFAKQVLKNECDKVGERYHVRSGLSLLYKQIFMICKKPFGKETYQKSVKINLRFAKSSTKTLTNHSVLCILAYVNPEWLKRVSIQNYFAITGLTTLWNGINYILIFFSVTENMFLTRQLMIAKYV